MISPGIPQQGAESGASLQEEYRELNPVDSPEDLLMKGVIQEDEQSEKPG